MEKFMLLFRGSDVYMPDQSPEALQALTQRMMAWVGDLSENGAHLSSEKLSRMGKTIIGETKIISNNPFGQAKEIIGGCTVIQVTDINEAVRIANACPILETSGSIEIRPILSFE